MREFTYAILPNSSFGKSLLPSPINFWRYESTFVFISSGVRL